MSSLMPIAAVLLALVAAGSVAYIAWQLSSNAFHKSFEDDSEPGRQEDEA